MLVEDLERRARRITIREEQLEPPPRSPLETEQEHRRRVAQMLARGASIRAGHLDRERVPCGFCLNPVDEDLERLEPNPERPWTGPQPCEHCGLFAITPRESKRLLQAFEEWKARQPAPIQTPPEELAKGRWRCQHGKTWYDRPPGELGYGGGYPLRVPTRLGTRDRDQVLGCGLTKSRCSEEHARGEEPSLEEVRSWGVTQTFSGLTAGSEGGIISMPFSSPYPQGAPSRRLPQ